MKSRSRVIVRVVWASAIAAGASACVGDTGVAGPAGKDGVACTIIETDGGRELRCPDGTVTAIEDGAKGSEGAAGIAGAPGKDGTQGVAGPAGRAGVNALIDTTELGPSAGCPAGAVLVKVGQDDGAGANAGNGVLDDDEIDSTRDLCHGRTGATGAAGVSTASRSTTETAGSNCAAGGRRIEVGRDADANGSLDDTEVEDSFFVCNGVVGEQGIQGVQGEQGVQGIQGEHGIQGEQGVQGIQGEQGIQGVQGVQGVKGETGETGAAGESVTIVELMIGDSNCPHGGARFTVGGSTRYACNGAKGDQGIQGLQGVRGLQGVAGDSVTMLDLLVGDAHCPAGGVSLTVGTDVRYVCDGEQGLQGAKGDQGEQGLQGVQGVQGDKGDKGEAGADGASVITTTLSVGDAHCTLGGVMLSVGTTDTYVCNGLDGVTGATGATGAAGSQGPQGIQGPQGPEGPTGETGATGATGPQGPTGLIAAGSSAGVTPYWNGSSWVTSSANLYNNGGNIGLGTTSPQAKLDVVGAQPGTTIRLNGKYLVHLNARSAGLGSGWNSEVVVNGASINTTGRSWTLTVISGSGATVGTVLSTATYDVYGDGAQATTLINAINAANTGGNLLVVTTFDEPTGNSGAVRDLLKNNYGAKKVYPTAYRDAYVLVFQNGFGPLGECSSATQNATGAIDAQGNNALAYCAVSISAFL